MQSLLRVLQEQEILPLGSNKAIKTNVRIISATNKDLPELCKKNLFRWDLYYRLTVTELEIPSLISRGKHEISSLLDYFIKAKKTHFKKKSQLNISSDARKALLNYHYPGNVRELENIIEQLYVFFEDKIEFEDLPKRVTTPDEENPSNWQDVEKKLIINVMKSTNQNQRQALKLLGYGSINTLVSKIKKYNI